VRGNRVATGRRRGRQVSIRGRRLGPLASGLSQIPHVHGDAEASTRPARQTHVWGAPSTDTEAAHPNGYRSWLAASLPSGARQPLSAPPGSGSQSAVKEAVSVPPSTALAALQPPLAITAKRVASRVPMKRGLMVVGVTSSHRSNLWATVAVGVGVRPGRFLPLVPLRPGTLGRLFLSRVALRMRPFSKVNSIAEKDRAVGCQ
jgi:hypothetical protein